MADAILRIKTVMDINDAASNIGALQKGLNKLKLPDKLNSSLNKNISEFYKEYDKYQRKVSEGIKTQSDQSQAEKSLNRMKTLYSSISKELNQVTKLDIDDIIDLGSGDFKRIADEISRTVKEINKIKVDKKPFQDAKAEIESLTKSKKVTGDDGILNRMLGHINKGEITEAKNALDELKKYAEKAAPRQVYSEKAKGMIAAPGTMSTEKYSALQKAIAAIEAEFGKADAKAAPLIQRLNELQKELGETKTAAGKNIIGGANDFKDTVKDVEKVTDSLKKMHQEEYGFKRQTQDIDRQIQSYFGLAQMIRKVGDIARAAFNTVKELDAAMVETAVVTNFDVSDMWAMLPEYTAQANQLGSTIKDVYEAATLYFQQGLNKQQSLGLANETLKMARIGGLQAAEATNMMTAALRGFNMEINGTSAKRINDVYSELAAITAADTKEIGSAMERTASIANSANMEFETTSAFLAQMIETTREAPENLGTAMKTIIARFQEMKQDPTRLVDSEGVAMDANKIDTALKTIGVDLTNQKGEFRDLDDVFLEISEKWDSLTQGQQRYIATIAAGSRQQSRFIAMMQNHERVMELVEAANNSAGASQKQFEKTLDSMSSKLNRLKNAWNQFTMGLMNDKLIKGGTDALTKSFTVINKIIDWLGKIPPKPFEGITKSALTLATTLGMLNIGKKMTRGSVMGVVGWWKKEGGFMENFKEGYGAGEATGAAKQIGTAFGKTFQETAGGPIKSTIEGIKNSYGEYKNTMAGVYGKYSAGFLKSAQDSDKIKTQLATNLRSAFKSASANVDFGKLGYENADVYMDKFLERMKNPKTGKAKRMSFKNISDTIKAETGADISSQKVAKDPGNLIDKSNTKLAKFSNTVSSAGNAVQYFGMLLQNTPLAPFGTAISALGMGISAFGANIAAFQVAFTTAMEAGATSIKAFGVALWSSFGPIAAIMAALLALVGIIKLVDAAWETDKERLERMKDAAASASEAFDMAKQQTSELNDMLSRLEENEKSFDNLVEGTTEFNEQLVASNELVTELLQKFPMLNDPKYLSTDENGLMRINKAGIQAVKDYQKEIEARATAMSLIQSADYSAEENIQKAKEKEKGQKYGESDKAYQKRLDEAELLRQQAETEREIAKKSALRTALDAKHIQNVEALSEHYAKLYDSVRDATEAEAQLGNKHELRQEYANFHGYTYEKSTKKMFGPDGSEIDYDDAAIKDEVVEQRVLLQFEEDAGTLDGILADLDSKFSEVLKGSFEGSNHVISDLLSSNIEADTDLLEKIIGDTSELEEVVNSLKEEEIAAILGKTTEEVAGNVDTYKKEVVDLLTQKASNIAEAQAESYSKLAEMMARSSLGSLTDANLQQNKDLITEQIKDLKQSEANTLSTIGQLLQEQVGVDAMSAFIDEASFIYLNRSKQTADKFNDIIENVNWESPTSRLEAYNKMLNSTDKNIQKVGKSMLSTAGEANIVGEAFDEFLGGDWLDLQENADSLKNSLGEIDGLGVLNAAESSKTLKTLLDSGRVSAGGLAMALQAVDSGSISQASSAVLELLSAITKTTDVALEAHNIIENFDPGIDYSESNDFMIEGAEKVKELMGDNKWGNPQLETYIKLAAGQEKWNKTYLEFHGDVKKTTKALQGYALAFENGITPVYDKLASGKGINGEAIKNNIKKAVEDSRIDQELADKFNKVDIFKDKNGFIQFDFGDLTTEEFQKYLEIAGDMGDQAAAIMIEHLANYNETELAELEANNLKARIKDPDFQKSFLTEDGKLAIDNESLKTLESVLGEDNFELLAKELGFKDTKDATAAKQLKDSSFKVINEKTGERLEGGKKLTESYAKKYYEKETTNEKGKTDLAKLSDVRQLQTDMKFDFAKFMADNTAKHMNEQQAQENAWATYQALKNSDKPMLYNGMEVSGNLKSAKELLEEFKSLDEKQKWYDVGKSIAEGIISFIDKKNKGEEDPDDYNQSEETKKDLEDAGWNLFKNFEWLGKIFTPSETNTTPTTSSPTSTLTDTSTPDNFDAAEAKINAQIKSVNEHFANLLGEIKPEEIDTPEKQASLKELANASLTSKLEKLTPELYKSLNDFGIDIQDAVEAGVIKRPSDKLLNQVKKKAEENADAQAEASASGYSGVGGKGGLRGLHENGPKKAQEAQQAARDKSNVPKVQKTTIKVETKETGLKETKDKVDKLKNAASKTQTIKVGAKTNKSTSDALEGIKKIREAAKKKSTVNVDAKVKGKDDTNNLSSVIKNVKAKAVNVKANVSGANKVSSLKSQLNNLPSRKDIYITTHKNTVGNGKAKGQNNYIPHRSVPSFGSVAKGARYGRLGPKGKGGLTLTGEKGFEIAWIPSESRSMVLGAEGPQMLNLPNDAVVYTHEQSKKIIKQKSIPAGSHSGMNPGAGSGNSNSSNTRSSSHSRGPTKTSDKGKKQTREIIKAGKITSWVFNMEQKIAQVKIKQEQAQKKLNKQLEKAYNTIKSISKNGDEDIKRLKQSVSLNQQLVNHYKKQLKNLNKTGKTTIEWSNPTKERTKKKGKWGKWKSSSDKKHKASVNLGSYIYFDEATGAYVVDYQKINKKFGKDKNKAKAVKEAAEKAISENTSKRDSAKSAMEDAQEKLEELGKTLYEQFYGWENELTKILKITKQIEATEKQTSRLKQAIDLDESMSAGLKGLGNSLDYFKAHLNSMVSEIQTRTKAIDEQKEVVKRAISTKDEKEEYNAVKDKLSANTTAQKNKESLAKAKAQVKADEKAIKARNNVLKKTTLKKEQTKKTNAENKLASLDKKKKKDEEKIKKANKILNGKSSKKEKKKAKKDKAAAQKDLAKTKKQIKTTKKTKNTATKNINTIKKGNTASSNLSKHQKALDAATKKNANTKGNLLSATEVAALEAYKQEAYEKLKIAQTAQKYVSAKMNADGTAIVTINEKALEIAKNSGEISKEMYEGIKSYFDAINEESEKLSDLYESQMSSIANLYDTLKDLKDQYADRSEELLDSIEEADKKEVEKLEKLNSALTDALKDLLDEVKTKLDERRKLEDNKKKEEDIYKKQQRLAALRADTSGGHQVEIAQLEKEIAEAQQSYGRDLEDQLLDKLQKQADEAAKQRERQIELMNAQLDVNKENGNNLAQVNEYLRDPERYKNEIFELWKVGKDYDNQTDARKATLDTEWVQFWKDIQSEGLPSKIEATNGAIAKAETELQALRVSLNLLTNQINQQAGLVGENNDLGLNGYQINSESAKILKESFGAEADTLKAWGYTAKDLVGEDASNPIYSAKELRDAGFSATDLKDAGINTIQQLKEAGYSTTEIKEAGFTNLNDYIGLYDWKDIGKAFTAQEFKDSNVSYANAKAAGYSPADLKGIYSEAQPELDKLQKEAAYQAKIISAASNKKIGKDEFLAVKKVANAAGHAAGKYMQDLANTSGLTWKQVIAAANAAGFSRYSMAKTFNSSSFITGYEAIYGKGSYAKDKKNAKAKAYGKYLKGGLADYTGPAWLDGTPSKPELVLNAADTKNFLALKDVLSRAVRTSNSISNSYGDAAYEININVDHISSDYDVDKVAERVKKIIVKDAGYRNVTQVRNLR